MGKLLCYWASLALLAWPCIAEKQSIVPKLTLPTFSDFVAEHETVLVNFCTQYGGHCKALAPEYERAAKFLVDHNIHLAGYDCNDPFDFSSDNDFCGNMGIKGYPTLLLYRGDTTSPTIYSGSRKTAEDIISHMTNGTYPTHTTSISTTSTQVRTRPTKTPSPNPSPNPTASNAVWLAEDGSQALVKLAIPGLFDPSLNETTREEKLAQRMKRVIYIRHQLQKTFLARKSLPPSVQVIAEMTEHIGQLESYEGLEVSVIRNSNIHKVLKKIAQIPNIPGEDGREFLRRSEALVDLYYNAIAGGEEPVKAVAESSVLLNFTISEDGKHLRLNSNYHALQIPDPSRPALLQARKFPSDVSIKHLTESEMDRYSLIGLDYSLDARNRDDPGINYYNYHPDLSLNLIGAGGRGDELSDPLLLLDSLEQKWVEIYLHQTNGQSSDDPNRVYGIDKIEFMDRSRDVSGRRNIEYRAPRPDDRPCNLRSWRCADIADPPWYKDVWRENFDEFGRKGCLRRALLIRWLQVKVVFPEPVPWWAKVLPVLAVGMYVRGRLARQRQEGEVGGEKNKDRIG